MSEEKEIQEKKAEEKVEVALESPGTMRVFDPFLFLIGHRGAIERIAATPWALLVGAVFVVSAGIARNYDHHVLTEEVIWIAGPFIASIVTTTFVYIWVTNGLRLLKFKDQSGYLTFLTFVWMTAPCAWLYGIPVESHTDIVTATKWNIGFLAVVSLWRVVLMIRAVCVLTNAPTMRVSLLVLTPAALEMMFGSLWKGMSLINIMGGVRLSPQDQLLREASQFTTAASFWIFLLGVILLFVTKGKADKPLSRPAAGFPRLAIIPALICTALWALTPIPHHEKLSNRNKLKELFWQDRYQEAVEFASSKQRSDFPANHYLPPEPGGYHYQTGHLKYLSEETPDWLREEWINSAIEAHKTAMLMQRMMYMDEEVAHPKIMGGMEEYAGQIEANPNASRDEREWLQYFKRYKEGPSESAED